MRQKWAYQEMEIPSPAYILCTPLLSFFPISGISCSRVWTFFRGNRCENWSISSRGRIYSGMRDRADEAARTSRHGKNTYSRFPCYFGIFPGSDMNTGIWGRSDRRKDIIWKLSSNFSMRILLKIFFILSISIAIRRDITTLFICENGTSTRRNRDR